VQEIIEQLQPFNWNCQPDIDDGKQREIRPICVLENGAVYQGEWLVKENQKDRRGV
jgi:hypothetical protein